MSIRRITVSHPTPNANVRALLDGLADGDLLARFVTSVAIFPNSFPHAVAKTSVLKQILRRAFPSRLRDFTDCHPTREILRNLCLRFGIRGPIEQEFGFFSTDRVNNDIDTATAKFLRKNADQVAGVFAYEDCALETFSEARRNNKFRFYELPTCYWRVVRSTMSEAIERKPIMASSITGLNDSKQKCDKKDRELELADQVFVASSFTARSLSKASLDITKVKVIPYGFPSPLRPRHRWTSKSEKLRVLFVGKVSELKGISYLFDAVEGIGRHLELTVVGRRSLATCEAVDRLLGKYNYIESLPHHKILETMFNHDVLVLPSLLEGFGLVITEAMSQGMAVITTDRTAGPDLINDGQSGFLIDAFNADIIRERLESLIADRNLLSEIGTNAQCLAKSRPWIRYSREMADEVSQILSRIAPLSHPQSV